MANSDKNILITPNRGQTTDPIIEFTGANATPLTLRVLDDGTVSFEGTAGQLFSISDGLSGTIFSVNDISGIPSIEVLDDGTVKLAEYGGTVTVNGQPLSSGGGAKYQTDAPSAPSTGDIWVDSDETYTTINSNDYVLKSDLEYSGINSFFLSGM
jgi:hypothetical protein